MKNNLNKVFTVALLIAMFLSCREPADLTEVISVNLDDAISIDLSKGRLIELETTDRSLLYDIIRIVFLKEKMFILTRDKVAVFDINGKYLFNLSGMGQGPREYISIGNLFAKNGQVYLHDSMGKKMIEYTNKPENINTKATFIRYVNEDDRYLRFMFAFRKKNALCFLRQA